MREDTFLRQLYADIGTPIVNDAWEREVLYLLL